MTDRVTLEAKLDSALQRVKAARADGQTAENQAFDLMIQIGTLAEVDRDAAINRAEAAELRAAEAEATAYLYRHFAVECAELADVVVRSPNEMPPALKRLRAIRARAEAAEAAEAQVEQLRAELERTKMAVAKAYADLPVWSAGELARLPLAERWKRERDAREAADEVRAALGRFMQAEVDRRKGAAETQADKGVSE